MSALLMSRKASLVCNAAAGSKTVKAKPTPPKKSNSLSVLASVQVEKLGLLSKAEAAGFSLTQIEESGLLTFAEESGVLSLIADKNTPGLLNLVGLGALGAAAALVLLVPDDSTAEIAAQALGAIVLGGAGAAGLVGGSVLGSAQKL